MVPTEEIEKYSWTSKDHLKESTKNLDVKTTVEIQRKIQNKNRLKSFDHKKMNIIFL